jgi:hypothetical protein
VIDVTVLDLHFASTAQAVTACVGYVNTLTQSGIQNGLSFFHFNGGTQGFKRELIAHGGS